MFLLDPMSLHFALFTCRRPSLSLSLKYNILATSHFFYLREPLHQWLSPSRETIGRVCTNRLAVSLPRCAYWLSSTAALPHSLFGYWRPVGDSELASSIAIQGVLPSGSQWKAVRSGWTGLPAASATVKEPS